MALPEPSIPTSAWIRASIRVALENEHSRFGALAREWLFLRQCRKEAAFTSKVARALDRRVLNTSSHLSQKPQRSQTLFILAGGASVNELTPLNLETMAGQTSIGINFWPIHPFVPNALSTETDNTPGGANLSNTFLSEEINSQRVRKAPPDIMVVRPPWPPNKSRLYSLSSEYDAKTWVYGRANVITKSPANLAPDLGRIIKRAISCELPSSVLPDNGSSVVRLTFWGLIQGYEEIVWVGVDQDSGGYFWTEAPVPQKYRTAAELFPRETGQPHSTSSAEHRPFSNDFFLRELANAVKSVTKQRIYVAHNRSSLSDSIPVYRWENSTQEVGSLATTAGSAPQPKNPAGTFALAFRMRSLLIRDCVALAAGRWLSRVQRSGPLGPRISILIPTLDTRVGLLANRAIPSILAQSEQNFEVLIVTDFYSEGVKALVDSLDSRFTYLTNPRIPGHLKDADVTSRWCSAAAPALNLALARAHGEFIARLDDDDSWFPDHLAHSISKLEADGSEFVSSKCLLPDGKESPDYFTDDEYYGTVPKTRHPPAPIGSPITWVYRSSLKRLRYNSWSWKKSHNRPVDIDLSIRIWRAGVSLSYLDDFGAQIGTRGESSEWGLSAFLQENCPTEEKPFN